MITSNFSKYVWSLLVLLPCAACEKDSLATANTSILQPVVEAYLHEGNTPEVKVTTQVLLNADSTVDHAVTGLTPVITSGSDAWPLTYVGEGVYRGSSNWVPEVGKKYSIAFEYAGTTIAASTEIPGKPLEFSASGSSLKVPSFDSGTFPTIPDPIELTWSNLDGGYYLIVVENLETDPEPIFDDDSFDPPSFRTEPEQTDRSELGFQSFSYLGTHRIILFHITPEYAALYDDSGTNSQNLTAPYTNVTGGLGIFTGINSDTLLVEVTK